MLIRTFIFSTLILWLNLLTVDIVYANSTIIVSATNQSGVLYDRAYSTANDHYQISHDLAPFQIDESIRNRIESVEYIRLYYHANQFNVQHFGAGAFNTSELILDGVNTGLGKDYLGIGGEICFGGRPSADSATQEALIDAIGDGLISASFFNERLDIYSDGYLIFPYDEMATLELTVVKAPVPIVYVSKTAGCNGNTPCYGTISTAISSEYTGTEIRITGDDYDEDVIVDENKNLTLSGGWDSGFANQSVDTSINAMAIVSGSVDTERILINGP